MNVLIPYVARRQTASDGFIVVAVLWILSMLGALASIYAVFVINTAAGFAMHDERLRAEGLVLAAIELSAYRHLSASTQTDEARGRFSFRLEKALVEVEYQSEAGRIDINAAPKKLLVGLFLTLGLRLQDAEIYSDRIVAWRTPPTNGQDTEALAYRTARLAYTPRGAKFPDVRELSLVRDLPIAIVERVLPMVTVYSGRPQVNILEASPQVLAALPGMTKESLDAIEAQRRTDKKNAAGLLPLLGAAQQYATTEGSNALRVAVRVVFDNGRHSNSEVVILVFEQGDSPFGVLSWRDELNAPSASAFIRRAGFR